MNSALETRIINFVRDDLLELDAGETIDEHESLLAEGMVDSLGMVRLVAFIEDELSVTVPPEDFVIAHFNSVTTIAAYLRSRGVTHLA